MVQVKQKRHQCNVIEFMKGVASSSKSSREKYSHTKGLLVAHGMGSGKTLTALWVAKDYVANSRVDSVYIIAPNVAVGEFVTSFDKAGITPHVAKKIKVITHDGFVLNGGKCRFRKSLVIVDEAHMITGNKYAALAGCNIPYLMLLTGTPAPNTPSEIVPLINLLCTDRRLRWGATDWDETTRSAKLAFMKNKVSVHNIGSEHSYMKKRGTVFDADNHFPGYKVTTRSVKLSSSQNAAYLNLSKRKHTSKKHPFYQRERKVVSRHSKNAVAPKVARVARDVAREIKKSRKSKNDPARLNRGRLLLYAYNKDVTVDLEREIRRLCTSQNVSSPQIALYNGGTSAGKRAQIKKSFNSGALDVLIISKAGSVGLDLQCTAKVFLYDMWWNIPQMNQIIGRAIRYKSHQLPCKHSHVDVYIYVSKFSTKQKRGVRVYDHEILTGAVKKWRHVANMIEHVMKPSSIKNFKRCRS